MLGKLPVSANIATRDLEAARRFYVDILGLEQVGSEGDELIVLRSGPTAVNVYRSDYAGTNRATALTWDTDAALDGLVQALRDRGVRFEHYPDLPGLQLQGDVHVAGHMKLVWFKDPDGNILNLVGR
ncbi:MAG: VOC family protein [Aquabacterium sp.]|jgi:catechol 2,3-dioxygenase-like lactoylglutathione lyase family enzyme|nr:MAG: VOC family protein [Aquabacterium sp.]